MSEDLASTSMNTEQQPPDSAASTCCAQADAESAKPCSLCQTSTCKNCRRLVNGKRVCGNCHDQIMAELEKEQAQGANLPIAVAAGLVTALLGGAVWATIAVLANLEVGYVAVGVGWLVGIGVVMGAGGKKGRPLQLVAVGCAVLGLLLGKYFTLAHAVKEYAGQELVKFEAEYAERSVQATGEKKEAMDKEAEAVKADMCAMRDLSYFSPDLISLIVQNMGSTFGPFDLLWLFLALGIAWRTPAPTALRVR